jgi:hypothetical protein
MIWHRQRKKISEALELSEGESQSVTVRVFNEDGEPLDTSFDLVAYIEEVASLIVE